MMSHLTVEKIIEFVSINELTSETMNLASDVNTHIRSCQLCREKVAAFQSVYEELCRLGRAGVAKEYLYASAGDDRLQEPKEDKEKDHSNEDGGDVAANWRS